MPGRNNSSNSFGFSSYVVGETLGDGCNYAGGAGLQQAMDDLFMAGGGVVLLRPSTVPYTVNLTIRSGVDIFGASVDGRLPATLGQIDIVGNHTWTGVGGIEFFLSTNVNWSTTVGDLFTLNEPVAGSAIILAMQDCRAEATTDPASRIIVMNAAVGGQVQYSNDNCNIDSTSHFAENIGAGSGSVNLQFGTCSSSTGNILEISAGSGSLSAVDTIVSGSSIVNFATASGSADVSHCDLFCSNEAFLYTAASGVTQVFHSKISSSAASGNFVDGVLGTLNYDNVVLTGTATGIGATITANVFDWKPYGTTTSVGVNRYDPADFSVVAATGEVSLVSPFTAFTWVDQPASTTVLSNQGNFVTGVGVTLTLPAAPVQGDVVKFKDPVAGNAPYVIQANAGQTLQVGNQTSAVAGTATSTLIGDAMELTFHAAGSVWCANAIIGNFLVV